MSLELHNTVYFGAAAPGIGSASAKPVYVSELPETGKEGVLYLVPTGVTRDGYQIFQEFVWYNNGWKAIGAYDVGIDPDGIWTKDNLKAGDGIKFYKDLTATTGVVSLSSGYGYLDAVSPANMLALTTANNWEMQLAFTAHRKSGYQYLMRPSTQASGDAGWATGLDFCYNPDTNAMDVRIGDSGTVQEPLWAASFEIPFNNYADDTPLQVVLGYNGANYYFKYKSAAELTWHEESVTSSRKIAWNSNAYLRLFNYSDAPQYQDSAFLGSIYYDYFKITYNNGTTLFNGEDLTGGYQTAYSVGSDPFFDANTKPMLIGNTYATADTIGGIKQSFDASTGTWTVITENL